MSAASSPADHDPAQPGRHHVLHEQRKRRLRGRRHDVAGTVHEDAERRHLAACAPSASAIMPGTMKMKTGKQLEKRGEDRSAARFALIGRAERALDDVLIRAPVPEADNRRAEEHAEPRVVLIEVPRHPAGFSSPGATCSRRRPE